MRSAVRSVLLLCLAVAACATEVDDEDFVSTDIPEETDVGPKADQPELPFTVVEGLTLRESVGVEEEGRVIRSATAFRRAFGTTPPEWLDFDEEWLAVYSGGVQRTGGYQAEILSVRLSDSGKSVKVIGRLQTPGEGCIVTQAFTKPFAVVRFPAQPGAATSRFTKLVEPKACVTCGEALTSLLATTTRGMIFTSEGDFPLEVLAFEGAGAPTVDKIVSLTGASGSITEERAFASLMDRLVTVFDPADPFAVEYAARWQALREVMEAHLTSLTVIRLGEISIDVYIVGESACGDLVGVKTTSIET